jgi:hypothetical protein
MPRPSVPHQAVRIRRFVSALAGRDVAGFEMPFPNLHAGSVIKSTPGKSFLWGLLYVLSGKPETCPLDTRLVSYRRQLCNIVGRFKSFPVQLDGHLYIVLRYAERNPVRAKLVRRAENWMWSSLWRRTRGNSEARSLLSSWPIALPDDCLARVNQPLAEQGIQPVRHSVTRGTPFGAEVWRKRTAGRLGLNQTLRPRGRPRKPEK